MILWDNMKKKNNKNIMKTDGFCLIAQLIIRFLRLVKEEAIYKEQLEMKEIWQDS